MALTRGFIRNTHGVVASQWVLTGILLGLSLALVIYGFSIQFMEAFRFLTFYFVDALLVLSAKEELFYNSFYAAISSIIGCSFALKFIVENSRNRIDKKIRLRQTSIINDQHFTTWHTINWMGKVFLITGIWFILVPMHFEISFYDDFLLFLLLLPVVWYISLWSTFIRLFGVKSYRWIGIATTIIVLNSFLLTRLDVVDTAKINEKLFQTTIDYNYEVNVPESTSPTRLGFPNLPIDFYVGFKKHSSGDSIHILGSYSRSQYHEIPMHEIKEYIDEELNRIDNYFRYRAVPRLFIDENVKMQTVHLLEQEMGRCDISKILFHTRPKNSSYPKNYPGHDHLGFKKTVPLNCDCEIDRIDSLKSLHYTAKQIRFPETYCYRVASINKYNRVKVTIDGKDQVYLNGSKISDDRLREILTYFINKYNDNYVLLLDVNDQSTYGRYIAVMDLIRPMIVDQRNIAANQLYHVPYHPSENVWGDEKLKMKEIELAIPLNVIEFTYADRYLYEFMSEQ